MRVRSAKSEVESRDLRFVICSFAICLFALTGCGGSPTDAVPTFVPPTTGVEPAAAAFITRPTYEVVPGTLTDVVAARGDLVATQQAALFLPVGGTVKAVNAVPGAQVDAGDTLAELAAPSQAQNLLQRESNLTVAELNLEKLEAAASPSEFDLAIRRENVALAEALLELAQEEYAATVLTAPFAGTITMFNIEQGSRVNAYETVGVVADLSEVEVRGTLPATVRERVSVGQAVEVQIDGYGATAFTGTVAEIADEAATWQGELAYALVVTLDPDQALPGIAQVGADILVVGETHTDVPWVPSNALITIGADTYLDLLTESGIERVAVETGIVEDQRTEIADGVALGDTVVLP